MNKKGKLICIKQCSNCGKDVEIRHKERTNRKNIFCCIQCEKEFNKRMREEREDYFNCICPICNKKFHIKPYQLNKSKNHYCSRECHRLAKMQYMKGKGNHQYGLKGDKNCSWKSDRRITNYGYIKIRVLDHPFKDCDGFVFEHRLIAEKYLLNDENSIVIDGKKYLKPEYEVHHKDMNRTNNEISNLQIMTKKEHISFHGKTRNNKKVDKLSINGEFIETYPSIKIAGEKNNIFPQNIWKACQKENGFAKGYIWKYNK